MFCPDDTIVAIATPAGHGGIGVVRLSGPESRRIAAVLSGRDESLAPRHATLARIAGASAGDQAILTLFPAPHSYTGEDVVEISAHGSPVTLRGITEAAIHAGARLAEPGEFTLRAYLNGRIDLVQAEAVRDLIDAVTPLQARAAFDQLEGTLTTEIRAAGAELFDLAVRLEASLDFPEEGYHFVNPGAVASEIDVVVGRLSALLESAGRGRLIREGVHVTIAGRPNTGKSSLFNRLAGVGRAIVTPVPGTTRDLLTETVDVDGIPMTFVDTAGVHDGAIDPIEIEGIMRARAARETAALVVLVLDRSAPMTRDDWRLLDETAEMPRVVVANKIDLPDAKWPDRANDCATVRVSAKTGEGLDSVRRALSTALTAREAQRDIPAVTNVRHAELISRAKSALEHAHDAALAGATEEFVLADIHDARSCLEEITGTRTPDDVLETIFGKFCIGK